MKSYLPASKLSAQLKRLFRPWLILAIAAAVAALAAYALTMPERGHVTAVVNYSYDGVESGLDPAGNRFDPAEIKSAKVIWRAADELGMQLNDDDVERIRKQITVIGSIPASALERTLEHDSIYGDKEISTTTTVRSSAYYPTQYTVSFDFEGIGYSAEQATSLLNAILTNYEAYFYKQYGYNESIEQSVQAIDYNGYDYDNALGVLDNSLVLLRGYLNRLANHDYTRFTSQTTGYSFSDLVGAIDTIRSEDIEWVSSYIVSNNVTKSRAEQIDYYNYRIDASEREQAVLQERLETLDALIEGYTKTNTVILSAAGAAEGGEANGYEVSRQSDMYDSLINQRIACRTSLSETEEQIKFYQTRVERLGSSETTGNAAVVEEGLQAVDAKVKQLLADTNATADEYFRTVRLKRAFQVLSVSSGLSAKRVVRSAMLDVIAAEAFIFGAYLIYATVLALTPRGAKIKKESRKTKRKSAQSEKHK